MCMSVFTSTDLDEPHHDDENQSQEFSYSENILYPCCPAHTGAVHPGQEHCTHKEKKNKSTFTLKRTAAGSVTNWINDIMQTNVN